MSSWPIRSLGQTGTPMMPLPKPAKAPGCRPPRRRPGTRVMIAISEVPMMPYRIAPLTFLYISTAVPSRPMIASHAFGLAERAEPDQGGLVGDHDAGGLEAEEGQEGADAGGDGELQAERDGLDDGLSSAGDAEHHEQHTGDEHRTEGGLPR